MSTIDSRRNANKFHLLSTVWFVLREPFASQPTGFSQKRLYATIFGFDRQDVIWDSWHFDLMRDPAGYIYATTPLGPILGHVAETKRLVPKPILSRRLAHVAISCIRYLHRWNPNVPQPQDHLHAWAMKSRRLPWIWRRRLLVTSTRRGKKARYSESPWEPHSFPQSLRQLRHALCATGFQSEKVCMGAYRMYMWTLYLLYRTLGKAMKSKELIRVLSKPFIPSQAYFLFSRPIKRVRKAVDTYLEKVHKLAC